MSSTATDPRLVLLVARDVDQARAFARETLGVGLGGSTGLRVMIYPVAFRGIPWDQVEAMHELDGPLKPGMAEAVAEVRATRLARTYEVTHEELVILHTMRPGTTGAMYDPETRTVRVPNPREDWVGPLLNTLREDEAS